MGLPTVREGTFDSLAQSISEYADDKEFLLPYIKHLKKTNPVVLNLMFTWLDDLEGPEYLHGLFGMCVLYKLLETEAEVLEFEAEVK